MFRMASRGMLDFENGTAWVQLGDGFTPMTSPALCLCGAVARPIECDEEANLCMMLRCYDMLTMQGIGKRERISH
jgi:hypothetical protein